MEYFFSFPKQMKSNLCLKHYNLIDSKFQKKVISAFHCGFVFYAVHIMNLTNEFRENET